ncbi:MAG: CBS domain-containing protein [Acidimicrobiia bacterium]|nr:CBS domain-containing protein [Acidimicrobiia bacterium]
MKLHDPVELILNQKGSTVHSISPEATVYDALRKIRQLENNITGKCPA